MKFWASAECDERASAGMLKTWKPTEIFINERLSVGTLSSLNFELRYIPIIMPNDALDFYPKRSKSYVKRGVHLCAPQLDYDIFVSGSLRQQLEEYFRGISTSAPHLKKFGATPEQVVEFERIMAGGPGFLADHAETQRSTECSPRISLKYPRS